MSYIIIQLFNIYRLFHIGLYRQPIYLQYIYKDINTLNIVLYIIQIILQIILKPPYKKTLLHKTKIAHPPLIYIF